MDGRKIKSLNEAVVTEHLEGGEFNENL